MLIPPHYGNPEKVGGMEPCCFLPILGDPEKAGAK